MDDKFIMAFFLGMFIFMLVLVIRNTFISQIRKPLIIFATVLAICLITIIIYKMPAIIGFARRFLNSQGFDF
ncbi:MAG TPA: hypothetical protein DET40_07570 [Lentisphaeria bacterium]|nr:MAG: hypothetical protein A2X45_06725 [Lentisphaerae bacterium GWF2_50_93]HCE43391.1 hypothetical protein [Lentisphaeria bacterium]